MRRAGGGRRAAESCCDDLRAVLSISHCHTLHASDCCPSDRRELPRALNRPSNGFGLLGFNSKYGIVHKVVTEMKD